MIDKTIRSCRINFERKMKKKNEGKGQPSVYGWSRQSDFASFCGKTDILQYYSLTLRQSKTLYFFVYLALFLNITSQVESKQFRGLLTSLEDF